MEAPQKNNIIDFFVLLVKWKKNLLLVTIIAVAIGYTAIYFLVDEEFEATAVVMPRDDKSFSALSGIKKSLMGGLPSSLGGKMQATDTDLFITVIYSRSTMDGLIDSFQLGDKYKVNKSKPEWREQLIKRLRSDIVAKETKNMAFEITVLAPGKQLCADMANYLVAVLNNTIIRMENKKSKDNREFLEARIHEVREELTKSEDSLTQFQENAGMFEPKEQARLILEAYSTLETQVQTKIIEKNILERLYEKGSPQLEGIRVQVEEFQKNADKIKAGADSKSIVQPLRSIPKKSEQYIRLLREVTINNAVLEFLIPLYEQARFDEQRDLPILNVVDNAVPPVKKTFPPRTLFAILIGFGAFVITFFIRMVTENSRNKYQEKFLYLRENLFRWK